MKSKMVWLSAFCLVALTVGSVFGGTRVRYHDNDRDRWHEDDGEHISIDMQHGSAVIKYRDGRERSKVEITKEYELYIDDEHIATDADQKKLLKEFHQTVVDIRDYAKEIGWEGARIGLDGAKVGLQAGIGVLKMLLTSYDEDDLDRDLDRATEKIEKRAEKLEEKAEVIENKAYDLEDLAAELSESIPELGKLKWFY